MCGVGGCRGCSTEVSVMKSDFIGLVDCNNFFVSCERLFRPDLATKPVIVLSSNDGCVISRSKEVKELGIPMGIPYFEIRAMAEKQKIALFSSNFTLYRDISARVMEALRSVVDEIEPYSIDESFFAVPEASAEEMARRVRERIGSWVGVPVSIGVAETKTLAKLMSIRAKAGDGVAVLSKDKSSIVATALGEVWGVGPSARKSLENDGMYTIGDVLARRPSDIRAILGVHGERLHLELNGIPTDMSRDTVQKSMMSTRSFGARVRTPKALETALAYHLSRIAEKLRETKSVASGVSLYLRYEDENRARRHLNRFIPFPEPLSDTRQMATWVMKEMRHIYNATHQYTKAGIVAHGIMGAESVTTSLFGTTAKGEKVMRALDSVNARHGNDTLHIGTLSKDHSWESKRTRLSPSYTTSWTSLPIATL